MPGSTRAVKRPPGKNFWSCTLAQVRKYPVLAPPPPPAVFYRFMKTYTACVVGGGKGGRLSLNALRDSPRFQLLAAADVSPEARRALTEKYPGLAVFAGHQEMFAERPADVVCVSTWPPSHLPIARDALALPLAGILVEKPLGDTAAAGREIIAAVREKKIPLAVPHGMLVDRHVQEIIRRVRGGEIGELKLVEIQNTRWDIMSAGIHWLNFAVTLVNEPLKCVLAAADASTRTWRDGMQVETAAVTYAESKSGVRIVMQTGDEIAIARPGRQSLFRLAGTAGVIEFWGREASSFTIVSAEFPGGRTIEVEPGKRKNHQIHLENMAALMDGGQTDYAVAESSLAALELVEGAYLSIRHRCRVDLPLENFRPPPPSDWDPGRPYSGQGGGRDGAKLPR